jgi:hypothetical protein
MPEARRVEVVELPEAELHEIVPPPLPWRRSSVLPTSEILASPLSAVSALDDGELEYLFRPSVFHRATSFVRAVWFFGATFAIETVRWLGTSAPKQWARATARAYSPVVRST